MRTGIARGLLLGLSAVEQRRSKARSIGLWPAIMGSEEWERSAVPMQAKLMAATAWDPTAAPPPAPLPDCRTCRIVPSAPTSHRAEGRRPGSARYTSERVSGLGAPDRGQANR